MPSAATTIRLEPKTQAALQSLSHVTKRPMNKLVNEAVKAYVSQRNLAVEQELETMLAAIRAHRESDPDDEKAIDSFARNEAAHPDPAEGKMVKRPVSRKSRKKTKSPVHA